MPRGAEWSGVGWRGVVWVPAFLRVSLLAPKEFQRAREQGGGAAVTHGPSDPLQVEAYAPVLGRRGRESESESGLRVLERCSR